MAEFQSFEPTPPINGLAAYYDAQQSDLAAQTSRRALETSRQDLTDRATLRGLAPGLAANDPNAQATALTLPKVGGTETALGLQNMHADQRAALGDTLAKTGQITSAILSAPPEQREGLWQQFLPMMRQAGAKDTPEHYPGDDAAAAHKQAAVEIGKQIEILNGVQSGDPYRTAFSPPGGPHVGPGGVITGGSAPAGDAYTRQMNQAENPGGDPTKVNSGGYSGNFQFGAERLADPGVGVYTPSAGENLKKNQWTGTFNIPGFPDVKTHAQFLASPDAQRAAFAIHTADIDKAIAQTPGTDRFNQNGLRAVAHLGGVTNMQRFVSSGGAFDPADSNGTHLSDYYKRFSLAGPRALQSAFGHPDGPPGAPSVAAPVRGPAPVQVAGLGAPTGAPPAASPAPTQSSPMPAGGMPYPGAPGWTYSKESGEWQYNAHSSAPYPAAAAADEAGQASSAARPAAASTSVPYPAAAAADAAGQGSADRSAGAAPPAASPAPTQSSPMPAGGMPYPGAPGWTYSKEAGEWQYNAQPAPAAAAPAASAPYLQPGEHVPGYLDQPAPVAAAPPAAAIPNQNGLLPPAGADAPVSAPPPNTLMPAASAAPPPSSGAPVAPGQPIMAPIRALLPGEVKQYAGGRPLPGPTAGYQLTRMADGSPGQIRLPGTPPSIQYEKTDNEIIGIDKDTNQVVSRVPISDSRRVTTVDDGRTVHLFQGDKEVNSVPKGAYDLQKSDYERDAKELSGIGDAGAQAQSAQIRLTQGRDLAAKLATGANADSRVAWAALAKTYLPADVAASFEKKLTGVEGGVAMAQQFNKLMTVNAGQMERGVLGTRGGYQAMQLFKSANPGLELQPEANRDILNAQIISQQADADYARAALAFANKNGDTFRGGGSYVPLAHFDQQWQSQRNPQVYAAAMGALNQQPYERWSKGLSDPDKARALSVIARADPTASVIGRNGHPLAVSKFAPAEASP